MFYACPVLIRSKWECFLGFQYNKKQVLTPLGRWGIYPVSYRLILLHISGTFDDHWNETLKATKKGLERVSCIELGCDFYDFKIIDEVIKYFKSSNYKVSHVVHIFPPIYKIEDY